VCWLSARLAKRAAPAAGPPARPSTARTDPDPAEALANSRAAGLITRLLPYLTVVIAAFAPLAAAIYLLTTVAWSLAERRLFRSRTTRPRPEIPIMPPPPA
jgi:YidC/Oxa1 family membrane protein insertase